MGVPVNILDSRSYIAKRVKKTPYVLLALFLGGVGGHHFYAGKPAQGMLCLAFCWTLVPMVLGLAQAAFALSKAPDVNGYIVLADGGGHGHA